ncbi:MAG: metal ABC transporter permease [Rhodospirillaceae bacterium]|nr:metal ABC transporter permease [Rhodospirillaceae bacterium]
MKKATTMMDDFVVRALLAGIAVALAAAPLGAFIVWRKMAYFGGAISHTALLGVALGFLLGINPLIGVGVVCVIAALMLLGYSGHRLSNDTLLGIIAHGALAIGLIVASSVSDIRVDLMAFLFGDILSVSADDVYLTWAGTIVVVASLWFIYKPLLSITVHRELAMVEGVNIRLTEAVFVLLLAVAVALSIKVVGVLLVASMLIIPAAAARAFSATPERMIVFAAIAGIVAVCLGILASLKLDWPAGPAIVAAATLLYIISALKKPS